MPIFTVAATRSRVVGVNALILLFSICAASAAETNEQTGFHLPPGFSIQKVAGSPDIHFPMFGTLDDRGRLYVSESSGGDLYAELERKAKTSRISRLVGTNADGLYDSATVFVDGLSPCMGLVWHDHKLYAADPPDLVVLEDTDDDGHADRRTTLLTGFGHSDNGSLHGLTFGPDGWLYFTMGNPDGYDLTGLDGSHAQSRTGALIRCRPDGTRVETVAIGFENLVEIAWLPDGSMIGTVNWYFLPERGVRDALVQLLEDGQYPLHALQRGDAAINYNRLLPPISKYPAVAQSGLMLYTAEAFPRAMRDNLFSAQHNTRKIVRHVLSPKESSYSVEDVDFVTTDDPSVHFSDVLQDSDGGLLLIDTGSWYVHHCPTGRIINSPARGGVYRVTHQGADAAAKNYPGSSKQGSSPPTTSPAVLREKLHSTNTTEIAAAARALGRLNDKSATGDLMVLLANANPQIRLAAAEAIASCGDVTCVSGLTQALAGPADDFLTHALTFALHRLAGRESLEDGLENPNPKVQRAALLLLAQPPFNAATPDSVRVRLFAEYEPLRETARWILEQHSEWDAVGANFVTELVRLRAPTDSDQIALSKAIPQFQNHGTVIKAVTDCLTSGQSGVNDEGRGRLLEALAAGALTKVPEAWSAAIRKILDEHQPVLLAQALEAVSTLKITSVEPTLHRIAGNPGQPAALRISALRELVRRDPKLGAPDFDFVNAQLARNQPAPVRLAAAETLLAADLSPSQLVPFLNSIRNESLVSPLSVLTAVERQGIGENPVPLLDYLNASLDSGWTLPPERIAALQNALPSAHKAEAQKLFDKLAESAERQRQKLTEYEPLLTGGDHARGQVLFYNKATCSTCHSIWGIGGKVGPDLTKVGSIRAGRDILESIVLPSATIAQGYDVLNVRFNDGESVTGIRVGKGEDPLVLRDASGSETRYPRETVQSIDRSKVSLMPEGLLQQLTSDEIRDLLSFLQSLK